MYDVIGSYSVGAMKLEARCIVLVADLAGHCGESTCLCALCGTLAYVHLLLGIDVSNAVERVLNF